jgi:15-O-acetyltransferase Tri3
MGGAPEAQPPLMPPLVIEDYNWETSKTDPSVRQRRVIGTEVIVGNKESNAAGAIDLYLLSSVRFADASLTLSQLKIKLERVLVKLRFEHPEIGQTALWEEGQTLPLIQYKPLKSNEDALAWAQQLVRVRASTQTGWDIRTEKEAKRHQEGGSKPAVPVDIDVVAPVAGLDAALGSVDVEFIFHANHLYLDGLSNRMLVSDVFRYLAEEISSRSTEELPGLKWGEEVQNLGAPVLTLLKTGVELSGPSHDEAMKRQINNALPGMVNQLPALSIASHILAKLTLQSKITASK